MEKTNWYLLYEIILGNFTILFYVELVFVYVARIHLSLYDFIKSCFVDKCYAIGFILPHL